MKTITISPPLASDGYHRKPTGNIENDLERVRRVTETRLFNLGTMVKVAHEIDRMLAEYKHGQLGNYKQKIFRVHELRASLKPRRLLPKEVGSIRITLMSIFKRYIQRFIPVTSFSYAGDLKEETVYYFHLIYDENEEDAIWNRRIEAKSRGEVIKPLFNVTGELI